jgi:hypothetical protein
LLQAQYEFEDVGNTNVAPESTETNYALLLGTPICAALGTHKFEDYRGNELRRQIAKDFLTPSPKLDVA